MKPHPCYCIAIYKLARTDIKKVWHGVCELLNPWERNMQRIMNDCLIENKDFRGIPWFPSWDKVSDTVMRCVTIENGVALSYRVPYRRKGFGTELRGRRFLYISVWVQSYKVLHHRVTQHSTVKMNTKNSLHYPVRV